MASTSSVAIINTMIMSATIMSLPHWTAIDIYIYLIMRDYKRAGQLYINYEARSVHNSSVVLIYYNDPQNYSFSCFYIYWKLKVTTKVLSNYPKLYKN